MRAHPTNQPLPERLAYWYLRLNGFLTTENFVVHPDVGRNQRTDADLLGVRFAHRKETLNPMEDDPRVADSKSFCNVVIAEVKRGECKLNGPWTYPKAKNIHRVLKAIGCLEEKDIKVAAKGLYEEGRYGTGLVTIRLLAFGDRPGTLVIPVRQIFFNDMLEFIWDRFRKYAPQKISVGNWASDGQNLQRAFSDHETGFEGFRKSARRLFGLPEEGGEWSRVQERP